MYVCIIFLCVRFGNVIFVHIWFFVIHFRSKMCTLLFCFVWSRKPYLQLYVRVLDETQQQQKMKKLVNINMNDVDDEADAARHSLSNKAPMSFIFLQSLIIIDDR